MLTYLRKRIVSSALPLVAVILGVFALARMTGNPANLYLPLNATPTDAGRLQRHARVRRSAPGPDGRIPGGVFQLDFGQSLRTGEAAAFMALRAFPATLQLAA